MKIAIVSEDGQTISQHFGRAPYYVVIDVEGGRVTGREQREKFAHTHGHGQHVHGPGEHNPEAGDAHRQMLSSIGDCDVVIARGMGRPAYASLEQQGLKVVVTDVASIDQAVDAYLAGTLANHLERLH